MRDDYITAIYETLLGQRCNPVSGVEDAFYDGSFCETCYSEMRKAYARICTRLSVPDEDRDLEQILFSMNQITEELCRHMFELGARLGPTAPSQEVSKPNSR